MFGSPESVSLSNDSKNLSCDLWHTILPHYHLNFTHHGLQFSAQQLPRKQRNEVEQEKYDGDMEAEKDNFRAGDPQ